MFPFSSCISILRRRECATDWKQINGSMTFLICCPNNEPQRRGAISFEKTDNHAIYVRMLGDVKMRGSPEMLDTGQPPTSCLDSDRKMLDKLASDQRHRFRSRFLSVSKNRRQRKCHARMSAQSRLLVDEFYNSPCQLLLSRIGDWGFNIFTLDDLAGGRSVFHAAYHLFQVYDLIQCFQLDTVRLLQFFSLIERNYHESNPYHNALHAADVIQSMHCFLQEREVNQSTTDMEKMTALVAALVHDLDHPGVNNGFLKATSNHLVALYQNTSVLENHHWRSAVALLKETGLLSHLPKETRESFTLNIRSLILATDITRQQEFLQKFNMYIDSGDFNYKKNPDHRLFMLQIALKCADIANPCRPWKISKRWSRRVCDEFFLQGDTERALGIEVTPLFDRYGNTLANIQHGFMEFVVSPLFKAWDRFMNTDLTKLMLQHLAQNKAKWKAVIDGIDDYSDTSSVSLGPENQSEPGDSDTKMEDEEDVPYQVPMIEDDSDENLIPFCSIPNSIIVSDTRSKEVDDGEFGERVEDNEEEEEEERNEEEDMVSNDVGLLYHYPTESSEHIGDQTVRCLSPVNEDSEPCIHPPSSYRRFSMPHLVRRDLNFYLGMKREGGSYGNAFPRRQSLPVAALRHRNDDTSMIVTSKSSRSLSMDALLSRPKISNLSPNMDARLISGSLDPANFSMLQSQTLMLQGGSLTRFTSNPTSRQSSAEFLSTEMYKLGNNNLKLLPPDLIIPPYKPQMHNPIISHIGLASSWPSMTNNKVSRSPDNQNQSSVPLSQASVRNDLQSTLDKLSQQHKHSQAVIFTKFEPGSSMEDSHFSIGADDNGSRSLHLVDMTTNSRDFQVDGTGEEAMNDSIDNPPCLSVSSNSARQDDLSFSSRH